MNDRELLELAAKAGRVNVLRSRLDDPLWNDMLIVSTDNIGISWNPLTSDADAFRLAGELFMTVGFGPIEVNATTIDGALRGFFPKEESIDQGTDKAVRRVIVRAAAEVGENK